MGLSSLVGLETERKSWMCDSKVDVQIDESNKKYIYSMLCVSLSIILFSQVSIAVAHEKYYLRGRRSIN